MKKNNTVFIKEILASEDSALSHLDLLHKLGNSCNRVTVYRILDRLIEKGEIHKIIDTDGVSKFALCTTCSSYEHSHNHEHIHFSCAKCLVVSCLEEADFSFLLPKEYQILETNFTISGICPKCK